MKVSTKCVKLIASTHEPSNCVSLLFDVGLGFMLIENNAITICINVYVTYMYMYVPVVPHKAVAEVSKIGSL